MAASTGNPALRAVASLAILGGLTAALFLLDPSGYYLWFKSLHVIAVIAWMAAMLYLPRLFVYHCAAEKGSVQSETFKVMERRLLRAIMNPAMMVTWVVGLWLAWDAFSFSGGWLHAKIALVLLLSGVHGYFSKAVRMFAEDANTKSSRHWRMMNEVPTVIMIAVVILVIVKPF
jgi:putative membrane protein